MARTNICKDCGTTDGPWVGTNHNLCKGCADKRPKPEDSKLDTDRVLGGASTRMLSIAMLGAIAVSGSRVGRKGS